MKLRGIVLVIAIAACGKTSDVGALQEEALGNVNAYRERFDMLEARLRDVLVVRARRLSPQTIANATDAENIRKMGDDAVRKLTEMKNNVAAATNQIQNAAKGQTAQPGCLHS